MANEISLTQSGRVSTVTFNRPEVRNAISREMIQELTTIVRTAGADPEVRCLVFRGAGEHFSGGGDVKSFASTLDLSSEDRKQQYRERVSASAELFGLIEDLQKPIVAVARGAIAGAGLSFVMGADLALASDTAFCVFAHNKIAIALDSGLSYYLPRIVGARKARELTLTGARITAMEAANLGIVSRVIPDAELDAKADKLIAALAAGAPLAMGLSKTLLREAMSRDIRAQINAEAQAVGECAASDDFPEGIRAFLESRPPKFG